MVVLVLNKQFSMEQIAKSTVNYAALYSLCECALTDGLWWYLQHYFASVIHLPGSWRYTSVIMRPVWTIFIEGMTTYNIKSPVANFISFTMEKFNIHQVGVMKAIK